MSVESPAPESVRQFADQVVEYVLRSLEMTLEYDSETLPILDHWLRTSDAPEPAAQLLIVTTAGAYFGEVVRRCLGGRWDLSAETPEEWQLCTSSGLSFRPAAFAATAIAYADIPGLDSTFSAPESMRAHLEAALLGMADVTVETYYSLCGRLDTLLHLETVLLAVRKEERNKSRQRS